MKKFILILGVISIISVLNAQQMQADRRHKPDPRVQTERMSRVLGLSEYQKAKALDINIEATRQIKALKANPGNEENFRMQRRTIAREKRAQLKRVLTEEQFQRLIQIKKHKRQRKMSGRRQQ